MSSINKIQQDTAQQMQQFGRMDEANKAKGKEGADKKGAEKAADKGKDAAKEAAGKNILGQAFEKLIDVAKKEVDDANGQADQTAEAFKGQLAQATQALVNKELHGNQAAQGEGEGNKSARQATEDANSGASLVS